MDEFLIALQVLNLGATFKILFMMGGHGERLSALERSVFKGSLK